MEQKSPANRGFEKGADVTRLKTECRRRNRQSYCCSAVLAAAVGQVAALGSQQERPLALAGVPVAEPIDAVDVDYGLQDCAPALDNHC